MAYNNSNYYYIRSEDMAKLKYSRQREAIKEYLAQTKEHPTADTIYVNIRKEYPNISLGTVYRNLNLLVDHGEIIKINCNDGSDRFDGNPEPHYHFICNSCKKVADLEMESIDAIKTKAQENFDGKIHGYDIHFYGKCHDCYDK